MEGDRARQQSCCFPSAASAPWAQGLRGRACFVLTKRSPRVSPSPRARTANPDSRRNRRRHPHPGSTSNVTFSPRGVLNRPNDSRNVHLACCKLGGSQARRWVQWTLSKPAPQSRQPVTADHGTDISHPHQSRQRRGERPHRACAAHSAARGHIWAIKEGKKSNQTVPISSASARPAHLQHLHTLKRGVLTRGSWKNVFPKLCRWNQ